MVTRIYPPSFTVELTHSGKVMECGIASHFLLFLIYFILFYIYHHTGRIDYPKPPTNDPNGKVSEDHSLALMCCKHISHDTGTV